MSAASEFQDLIDLVEEQPGWLVVRYATGWKIYPADKSHAVIHTSVSTDHRGIDNFRAQLRRAGFAPLIRTKRNSPMAQQAPTGKPCPACNAPAGVVCRKLDCAADRPKASTVPAPRNLIAEARQHISQALEALTGLDTVLTEMGAEQESISKIRTLLQSIMK